MGKMTHYQGDFHHVYDYGAVGNGTNNDSDAFARTIATAQNVGGVVYIPPGRFYIPQRVTIDGDAVSIIGSGASSILGTDQANIIFLVQNLSDGVSDFEAKSFVLDGGLGGQLSAGLIQINNADNFLIQNVTIKNAGTPGADAHDGVNGVSVSDGGSVQASSGTIRDCLIEATTKAAINLTNGANYCNVVGNIIRNIGGNGEAPGIQLNGSLFSTVAGNRIVNTEGRGIYVSDRGGSLASRYFIISHNMIINSGNDVAKDAADGIVVVNNVKEDVYGSVVDNTVIDAGQNAQNNWGFGVHLRNVGKVRVMRNNIWNPRMGRYTGVNTTDIETDENG